MKKNHRVNILFTNASAFSQAKQIGGGEVHLLSLIRKLNHDRYKIFVAYPGPGPLEELLEEGCVTPVRVTTLRGKWEPFCVLELMSLIQRHNIHIVHAYEPKSGFWAMIAANLLDVPGKIYTVHLPCFTPHWKETGLHCVRDKIRYVRDILTSCMADRVIAVSEEIAREKIGRQGISPHKVETVLNGVDSSNFSPRKKAQGRLKEQFNIPKEIRLVGVVARLEPHKGHLCLLEAMQGVVEKMPDVWLLVIGEGRYEGTVRDAVWKYGLDKHVVFTGFQEDMVNVLSDLDLVVLPSMYESTNLSLVEAMLMQKPVVASAIPSHRQMVHDGVNGFLVGPGGTQGLSNAMIKILENPALAITMGKRGREIAIAQFNLDRMCKETENLYEALLGKADTWRPNCYPDN
jgi:glycosyltransferase involved in cell wall biosynthesis